MKAGAKMGYLERMVDNKVNTMLDAVTITVENKINMIANDITVLFVGTIANIIMIVSAIAAIAMLGYIVYNCICMMFLRKEDNIQKILFGTFWFVLIRIFGTIAEVKLR